LEIPVARTTDPTREALRALRDKHLPDRVRGGFYETPKPTLYLPMDLHPKGAKGKRLAETEAAMRGAEGLLTKQEDDLDAAESDYVKRDDYRRQREEVAAALARGEVGPEAVDALVPAWSDAETLARVETHCIAVSHARRNLAERVRDYDQAVIDAIPEIIGAAVTRAEALDAEAVGAENAAAAARAKANAASELARDLRLPEAIAACKAAGIGSSQGKTVEEWARILRGVALLGPVEGWSTERDRYTVHPAFMAAAAVLGVQFPTETVEAAQARTEALKRMRSVARAVA
jgi:hypothetical protein